MMTDEWRSFKLELSASHKLHHPYYYYKFNQKSLTGTVKIFDL